MRRLTSIALTGVALAAWLASAAYGQETEPTLIGRAVLPSATFADGPPAGSLIGPGPINGVTPPFLSQPVQGISAVVDARGGDLLAMPDNGFGQKTNSADFLLRVYRIRPEFETAAGGSGTVEVKDFIQLRDPDRRIPFPITNEATAERLLTGADFDIESLRVDKRGELWFGDEFGPFLLHTDATGKVLEAPIPLPGVKSPQNPTLAPGETPNLPSSRGFEGTAISPDGKTLYPMLEGALTADPDQNRRVIHAFDLRAKTYTGETWQYRTEAPENAIGDLTAVDEHRLLVIERDNNQGTAAAFKRIYVVDLRRADAQGFLVKREVLNLLSIRDPQGISVPPTPGDIGIGDPFSFPFQTIESVLPRDGTRLLVANDNNYPFSAGRNPSRPDDNELIVVRVGSLAVDPPPTPVPPRPDTVRFATFNASLNRGAEGQLVADLSTPGNGQARTVAEIIQRSRPDVLLINEFDFVAGGAAVGLFQDNYLSVSQNGAEPIAYPYRYVAPSNTGIPSGFDLDNNGSIGGGNDAFGFGDFPGQFGMAVYSRYPIRYDDIRTFQSFLWKHMPGALLPDDPATPARADWYSRQELAVFRLLSKSHWDVPIQVGRKLVHFLVSHPTPPVFDGPEDRNGRRNHDEIRFWADYITPHRGSYIYDDRGRRGGLKPGEHFVIAGDENSDPLDGDSVPGAIQQLLEHPLVNTQLTPSSEGAVEQAAAQGGANASHRSDPAFDTADFADSAPGNLRADYVLPRKSLQLRDGAVFWPLSTDPLFPLVGVFPFPSSDHRLVWVDVAIPGGDTHR